MGIAFIEQIRRLIAEHQVSAALRERIELINTQFALLQQHVIKLETENAALVKQCDDSEKSLARQNQREKFVESRGALFEPLAGNTYSETPRCPVCMRSMWCFAPVFPFECSDDRCGHKASFTGMELSAVIGRLP